ncbi:putative centrin [Toxoplasma gondii MAS]|uniref:Putative centrin n=1 Tax=Toxoplasma gondii MAS TaxID=943118 RepID=A0A086PT87_TOXGO|nr:putative centrin [Toxoplasma gondii MAS]
MASQLHPSGEQRGMQAGGVSVGCVSCMFLCVVPQGDKESREGIQKIFSLFDDDRTGTITLKNLKRVAKELGETMSEDELREMLERADSNGDGEISFEDFYAIMTKKTFP